MFQRLCCILFFVVCYRLGSASEVQSFSEEPTSSVVKPGGSLNLNCHVNHKVGDCMWQKDYTPIGVSKGKYEWAGNEKSGDCTLKILDAQADLDEGSWSCQVTWSTITARDALNSAKIYLSVGDNCNVGKPCSKEPGPDMDENDPPEKGNKDSIIAGRRNPVNSFSTHHRPPYSSFCT